jgi:hypothetical protein
MKYGCGEEKRGFWLEDSYRGENSGTKGKNMLQVVRRSSALIQRGLEEILDCKEKGGRNRQREDGF